jgi:transposase
VTLSPSQATWLFFRLEADRKPEEQETLRQLRQASPQIEALYQLVEDFLRMVRQRTADQLDEWLNKVKESHLQAFRPFVTGVRKAKEAVRAGLTLPWSTGPLEGQINRGIRSSNGVCMKRHALEAHHSR